MYTCRSGNKTLKTNDLVQVIHFMSVNNSGNISASTDEEMFAFLHHVSQKQSMIDMLQPLIDTVHDEADGCEDCPLKEFCEPNDFELEYAEDIEKAMRDGEL